MIQVNKKIAKVNEFLAHEKRINCAMIGPKSGQYVATGGDDKVINIWSMLDNSTESQKKPLFQLTGHGSAVQCLAFDKTEELIVAGSEKGSLRLWDLRSPSTTDESGINIINSLRSFQPGHKSSVNCVDFHPFGQYFASGSADTNIKVWDIRSTKSCLQTYKGHDSAITSLKFTPDGRMLVSGSANGMIKVWDLTSAKEISMIADPLLLHKKAVNCLQFHPVELLVASGSDDKTVKFWEFDDRNINFVASTELSSSSVRTLQFIGVGKNGQYVMPDDSSDMHLLCGASDGIRIYLDWDKRAGDVSKELSALNNISIRWSGICDMSILRGKDGCPAVFGISLSNVNDMGYLSVWVVLAPRLTEKYPLNTQSSVDSVNNNSALSSIHKSEQEIFPVRRDRMYNVLEESLTQDVLREVRNSSPTELDEHAFLPIKRKESSPKDYEQLQQRYETKSFSANQLEDVKDMRNNEKELVVHGKDDIIPRIRGAKPIGLQVEDFMVQSDLAEMTDTEIISNMMVSHEKMCSVIQARLTNMKLIERLWAANARDVREAMKLVVNQFEKHNDHALAVDILKIVMKPEYLKKYLNLDICVTLLPLAKDLCTTRFEEYITTALHTATSLFNCFNTIITSTLRSSLQQNGNIDLNAEDRRDKCEKCQTAFLTIKQIAESRFTQRTDDIGVYARTYVKTLGNFGQKRS
jgi:katanin p80 WD40 repeat-containing subunit B1